MGMPCLKPKLIQCTDMESLALERNCSAIRPLSWAGESPVVSMTKSALSLTGLSMSRSRRTACSRDPAKSSERGCLRLVSLNLRTSTPSEASKKSILYGFLSSFKVFIAVKKDLKSSPPRVSETTATRPMVLSDSAHRS